jgi:hypothetical protein
MTIASIQPAGGEQNPVENAFLMHELSWQCQERGIYNNGQLPICCIFGSDMWAIGDGLGFV